MWYCMIANAVQKKLSKIISLDPGDRINLFDIILFQLTLV